MEHVIDFAKVYLQDRFPEGELMDYFVFLLSILIVLISIAKYEWLFFSEYKNVLAQFFPHSN